MLNLWQIASMWLSTFSTPPTNPGQPSCQVVRMPGRKYSSGILTIVILTACQVILLHLLSRQNTNLLSRQETRFKGPL